ncbi:hypothetical protein, partial [Nocardia farcinica]|uniref:hypothetical protein n=1 Tax=Nocardia farcinica TaxID=37329 RepID=UPI001C0EFEF7
AKAAARELLDAGMGAADAPAFVDGAVEVRTAGPDFRAGADTLDAALQALVAQLTPTGYLAVMAYLDRLADTELAATRAPLES